MSASVISLCEARAARQRKAPAPAAVLEPVPFEFWTGASGRRYVHSIHSLVECPAMTAGNYILVRRDETGRREALAIGRVLADAATLNLADIRQRGAKLGANEVHLHLLADTTVQAQMIESDLRSSLKFG